LSEVGLARFRIYNQEKDVSLRMLNADKAFPIAAVLTGAFTFDAIEPEQVVNSLQRIHRYTI
jgi:hypothetical protein